MHLLEMNNTLVYAHKIQIYGSNYTFHLKSNISVSMTDLKKMFHTLYPQKSMRHICFQTFGDICDMYLY